MQHYLDFEKELALLDGKVNELRSNNSSQNEEKLKNKWILPLKDKLLALFKITDVTPEKFVERHNFFMDYLYVLIIVGK